MLTYIIMLLSQVNFSLWLIHMEKISIWEVARKLPYLMSYIT